MTNLMRYTASDLPALMKRINEYSIGMDDYLDRLKSLIVFIRKAIQGKVDETILQAENVGVQINKFNYNQF